MTAYHRFYSFSKLGNFELNQDFYQELSNEIDFLILLLTNYESKFELKNEPLHRFVDICVSANRILDSIGMKCDLYVRVTDDDGRIFPFEVYKFVSTCFKVLVTLFDGELGKWTNIATDFSNVNYNSTMDDSVCHDGKYCPEYLYLLTENL
ncbi:hypothetical protein D5R81_06465 [Parashewanella spongiae]|uniref:Uncharacterized protein n=1 Tax=Parashewanella spongiae TaxID=342950 RepID=A0A3A6TQE7_9GAMM|nr:hypothetical protein [Parashewanella spongiae]MCL1077588.1 hypothetical protein [Parashewanella spongiae]RJY18212.1 hypothetical protein D5R81_06465 [Parashewanella spongiae]